jgi:hypothetical protein
MHTIAEVLHELLHIGTSHMHPSPDLVEKKIENGLVLYAFFAR